MAKKLNEMLELLNGDLRNELKHMHFYLYHASTIKGLHREELREFLFEEAASEMRHVKEFQDLIIGLGGNPTVEANPFKLWTDAHTILCAALEMEEEVVENYSKRIKQAQKMGDANGTWIEVFLEDQIMHSRTDADNIRQMII